VAREFAEEAFVKVRFMPFQLYGGLLPSGASNSGVVKDELFSSLLAARAPDMTEEQRLARVAPLTAAWAAEGLTLRSPPTGLNRDGGGRMGSSLDAQRLILLARKQGLEDAMIEEVYGANHARDECLSEWSVLLACAKRAGVRGAEEALEQGWGMAETLAKIDEYQQMGVTAVPVCVVDSVGGAPVRAVLSSGAPEVAYLRACFAHLLRVGKLPWDPEQQPLPSPQPAGAWTPGQQAQTPVCETPQEEQRQRQRQRQRQQQPPGAAISRVLDLLGGGPGDDDGIATACGRRGPNRAPPSCDPDRPPRRSSETSRCHPPLPRPLPRPPDHHPDRHHREERDGGTPAAADENDRAPINLLSGSLRAFAGGRKHHFVIDADFVTCTQ
jgi:hypothetical protein